MVSLKYCRLKVAKEIAQAVDDVLRKETGEEIPDNVADVTGVIVIRFKKHSASATVMGDMRICDVADIFDQLLRHTLLHPVKGEPIAIS